jgi:hypothetical protein
MSTRERKHEHFVYIELIALVAAVVFGVIQLYLYFFG